MTFLHCIGYSDPNDLELLQTVLNTLTHIKSMPQSVKHQHDLFQALHRIAEAFIKDCSPVLGQGEIALNRANPLPLPLQYSFSNNWDIFDSNWPQTN